MSEACLSPVGDHEARELAAQQISAAPARPGEEAAQLSRRLSVSLTMADWLCSRGLHSAEHAERFLNPRLSELSQPDGMLDRRAAAERLARAIRANERIVVFGDYDCDGMTATAILTEMLRALGGNVTPLLASRFDGGYGLSDAALTRIVAQSPSLVVTCDCGSSDHPRLARLAELGIDAIVVDHHLVPEQPLPALAFLNPHRKECGFAYKGLASCGLVLSLGGAVRTALDRKLDLRNWLDLVAIGTVADVAPLDGDNRALVRAGLRALADPKRPGLKALLRMAKLGDGLPLSSEDIAFRIAPRLNAPGRLGSPDVALQLMLAQDADTAESLAARLEQASTERRAVQDQLQLEAIEEITQQGYDTRPAIVLGRNGWNHGIVGIVAGRLAERYARPVVVFGFDGEHGRGSVRGPAGARLHDALSRCESKLVRFGGHQAAAGAELEFGRMGEFREAFERAVEALQQESRPQAVTSTPNLWLAAGDEPERVFQDLLQLEPCGLTNPAPALMVEAEVTAARAVNGGHLKLDLELPGRRRLSAFGIALGERAGSLSGRVTLSGKLRADRYRGGTAVELFVERIL